MIQSRKKIKVDLAIFIAIFVALICFCFFPLITKTFEKAKEIANKKAMLETLEKQSTALQDFQNNRLSYEQSIEKIDKSFVSQDAPVEFIEFLEKLANKYGLAISLSSVRDVSEKKGNRLTTAFQARVTGNYPAVLTFLKKVEQSPWLIVIDQVSVDRVGEKDKPNSEDSAKNGQVALSLGFKTFSNYLGKIQ